MGAAEVNSQVLVMRQSNISPAVRSKLVSKVEDAARHSAARYKGSENIPAITSGPWKCSSG